MSVHTHTHTHTHPTRIPHKKTLPWLFVPAIPRPPDTSSFTQTHNTLWQTKKLAREVQEANVTTVSISSKLDLFSPHSLEDTPSSMRFFVISSPGSATFRRLLGAHTAPERPGGCLPSAHLWESGLPQESTSMRNTSLSRFTKLFLFYATLC